MNTPSHIRTSNDGDSSLDRPMLSGEVTLNFTQVEHERDRLKTLRQAHWRGLAFKRSEALILVDDPEAEALSHRFALTHESVRALEARSVAKGAHLDASEIIAVLRHCRDSTLCNFAADALNDFNKAYYSSPCAFSATSGIANFMQLNVPLNAAIGAFIGRHVQSKAIDILELSSGRRCDRWRPLLEKGIGSDRPVKVTLSDFTLEGLPTDKDLQNMRGATFSRLELSLLADRPFSKIGTKVDAIVATYCPDSIWFPEDAYYQRCGAQWYQAVHRVTVGDWHSKHPEILDRVLKGRYSELESSDFQAFVAETSWEKVEVHDPHVLARDAELPGLPISVPRGLVRIVCDAFDSALKDDGVFVLGEVGHYHEKDFMYQLVPFSSSGLHAKFKVEDYVVAEAMLRERGFTVAVQNVNDFFDLIHPAGNFSAEALSILEESSNQYIMTVSRR